MAGLIFWHSSEKLDPEKVYCKFLGLDYESGKQLRLGEWNAVVFPKPVYRIQNWLEFPGGAICGIGTFGYKGRFYTSAFPIIIDDIRHNRLHTDEFWGCFLILVYYGNRLLLIRDGAGISRLHSFRDKPVFSSSFSSLVGLSHPRMTLDRDAATELLCTGVLSSPATLLNEIMEVHVGSVCAHFKTVETGPKPIKQPKDRNEAINQQIQMARTFFNRMKNDWLSFNPAGVLDVGITGGMDSRLAAILAVESQAPVVLHTHWRKQGMADGDFRLAHSLAESTGLPLQKKKVTHPQDMSGEEIARNYEKSYRLSDGLIRPGCYWEEAYSTADYRLGLTPAPYLRILGFGGEQYRNGDRLPFSSRRSLSSWIKWEMIYRFAGANFSSCIEKKRIQALIERNIIARMGRVRLTLYNFKEYNRRIWVPSYRSLQTNMENRIGFCLSPFQDSCLSLPAQEAIPFLGRSLDFQLEMIARISPKIGALENDYGFNFIHGEPWHLKTGAYLWQKLPPGVKYPLYSAIHGFSRTDYVPCLSRKHSFVRELEEIVLALDLPLDLARYRLVRSRSRLLLNLGYFLKRNGGLIAWKK